MPNHSAHNLITAALSGASMSPSVTHVETSASGPQCRVCGGRGYHEADCSIYLEQKNQTPVFYSLPARLLSEGMSTDDGQDVIGVSRSDDSVVAEVYTRHSDDLATDAHNRQNSESRVYRPDEDVSLAVFADTQVDGRHLLPPHDPIVVAVALKVRHPHLRFGVLGAYRGKNNEHFVEHHYFVHDDQFAYDENGAHPMPYHGVNNDEAAEYNQETWYYDEPALSDLLAVGTWIDKNRIGPSVP